MESDAAVSPPEALTTALAEVHEHYRRLVEAAVRAGRPRLVEELSQRHVDEALRCITDWPGPGAGTGVTGVTGVTGPSGRRDVGGLTTSSREAARGGARPCQP